MIVEADGPKCGCGNKGCLEAFASRTAIFRRIQSAVKDGEKTILTDMLGNDLADMRSGHLRKAIRRGDKLASKIVEDAAHYLGVGVTNLVNLFGPEVVVLGGGVIEALADEMMSIIVETVKDHALAGTMKGVEIFASRLGDEAGITGGAVLAKQQTK
jgi:glucokinase